MHQSCKQRSEKCGPYNSINTGLCPCPACSGRCHGQRLVPVTGPGSCCWVKSIPSATTTRIPMSSSSYFYTLDIELQTKVREDFLIAKKAPTRAFF